MTTQSSPVITDMKVIPVAGHDSMLLNIGGAHNAYFTRNIVVLTDNAGYTGIGEAPGGEVIYQTLVKAIPMVLGQEVARLNKVVQQVHKGNQAADFDTFGKGAWTFELRVNAVAALEAALLDLVCAKITAWEESAPEFAEFNAMAQAMPGGIAVIRTLMDQYGLTLSDLPEIGSKSMVSRVLSGKRKLTLEHAKKLATRFGISPALFID